MRVDVTYDENRGQHSVILEEGGRTRRLTPQEAAMLSVELTTASALAFEADHGLYDVARHLEWNRQGLGSSSYQAAGTDLRVYRTHNGWIATKGSHQLNDIPLPTKREAVKRAEAELIKK